MPGHLSAVQADEADLKQVLRNLLSNAARFGPPGGIVTISASQAGGTVTVEIADEGPGFSSDEGDRVFGLFYRSPAMADRAGPGLGLFACRRLIRAMGGRIWARAQPGGGATFSFELPGYPADEG